MFSALGFLFISERALLVRGEKLLPMTEAPIMFLNLSDKINFLAGGRCAILS